MPKKDHCLIKAIACYITVCVDGHIGQKNDTGGIKCSQQETKQCQLLYQCVCPTLSFL